MKTRFFRFSAALLLAGAALFTTGCSDFGADLRSVEDKYAGLPGKVATLENQLAALETTLSTTYETVANHKKDLEGLQKDISDLETALKDDYGKKIQDVVDALNGALDNKLDKSAFDTAKKALEDGLKDAKDRIKAIEDADFQKQIDALDTELGGRLDALEALLAGDWDGKTVKEAVDAVRQSVIDLEASISGEIGKLKGRLDSVEAAIKTLNEKTIPLINQHIDELKSGKLDKSAFDAYEKATATTLGLLQDAVASLTALTAGFPEDTTIKKYIDAVSAKLDDYVLTSTFTSFCATVVTKDKFEELKSELTARLAALEALTAGFPDDQTIKQYIDARTAVLQTAIDNLNDVVIPKLTQDIADLQSGKLDKADFNEYKKATATTLGLLQDAVASLTALTAGFPEDTTIKKYIDAIVTDLEAALNGSLAMLEGRIGALEGAVEELLGRIQSIVLVPAFDDGKMTVGGSGTVVNTFKIMPADAAKDVVDLFTQKPSAFSFDVKTVATRSGGDDVALKLTVKGVQLNTANKDMGWVDVSVGSNFKELSDEEKAKIYSAALVINAISSQFYTIGQPTINGYEYVEMGDGLKWATMNVGATKPEEYGNYFAWGEIETKTSYSWSDYKYMESGKSDEWHITRYTYPDEKYDAIWYNTSKEFIGDGKLSFKEYNYVDDAARQKWGGTWRTPTDSDFFRLGDAEKYTWEWKENYNGTGKDGLLVTSKVKGYEGNQIFLPAAGRKGFASPYDFVGTKGYYWTDQTRGTWASNGSAWYLSFDSATTGPGERGGGRCEGYPIRPVSD